MKENLVSYISRTKHLTEILLPKSFLLLDLSRVFQFDWHKLTKKFANCFLRKFIKNCWHLIIIM